RRVKVTMPFTFDVPIDLPLSPVIKPEKVIVNGAMKGGASAPPIVVPFKAVLTPSQTYTKLVISVSTRKYTRPEAEKRVRTALVATDDPSDVPAASLIYEVAEALFTDAGTSFTKMLMRSGLPVYRSMIPLVMDSILCPADRYGYDFDDPADVEADLAFERLTS